MRLQRDRAAQTRPSGAAVSRRPAALCAALVCGAMLALAGCTSTGPNLPSTPTGPQTGADVTGMPPTDGSGLIPPDGSDGPGPAVTTGQTPSQPPGPPPVVMLPWLSGPHTDEGIVVDTDAGRRWQGPTAGSFALLDGAGYRWFGADGSMVGCVTDRGCVAIDGLGTVAVRAGTSTVRTVYAADGHLIGRFGDDGKELSSAASTPILADAVADTGVDLAGLVNAATIAPPFAGGVTGDPHLITTAGVRYITQATGQFIARDGDPAHGIQLQFSTMAHRDDVAIVSAVAIQHGDTTVVVELDATVRVNGYSRMFRSGFEQDTLDSGLTVGRWPSALDGSRTVAMVWPDGGSVVIVAHPALGMTVVAHLPHVAGVAGLFGTSPAPGDGQGVSDLRAGDGTTRSTRLVVESWRALASQRLFEDAPAESGPEPASPATVDPGAVKVADSTCRGLGFTRTDDVSACAFDVGLTGDTGFTTGHQQLATSAENPVVATEFAQRWPALTMPSSLGAADLPPQGSLDFTLASQAARVFTIALTGEGQIAMVNRNGCGVGQTPPGMDQPAVRIFDTSGNAVSDRLPLCGHQQTPTLPQGTYRMVVANGPSSSGLPVRVDVSVP